MTMPRRAAGRSDKRSTPKPTTWRAPVDFPPAPEPLTPPHGFEARAADLGIRFEPGELERLGRYLALLLASNKVVNLTAIRDPAEAWERHILGSLSILPVASEAKPADEDRPLRIIDVGTGGGLPGIPLAIALPSAHVTLLESTAKKCRFLQHAMRELELTHVAVVNDRAETAGQRRGARRDEAGASSREGALRDAFDLVVARAVGRLPTLLELTVPFAREGGLCALVKGDQAEAELAEAKQTLHLLHASHAGTIETPTGRIVVVEKRRPTPKAYPRASGEPKKHPLGVSVRNQGAP